MRNADAPIQSQSRHRRTRRSHEARDDSRKRRTPRRTLAWPCAGDFFAVLWVASLAIELPHMRGVAAGGEAGSCAGDCNADARVIVDELVRGVNIALGSAPSNRARCLFLSPARRHRRALRAGTPEGGQGHSYERSQRSQPVRGDTLRRRSLTSETVGQNRATGRCVR